MSTLRSIPLAHAEAPATALRAGVIAWPVDRTGIRLAQPEMPFDPRSRKPVELRIAFDHAQTPTAMLVDTQTGRSYPIEIVAPRTTFVDADPYTHIEIASAGVIVLSATSKRTDTGPRLLYARTSLLASLGVRGGRYPAPGLFLSPER